MSINRFIQIFPLIIAVLLPISTVQSHQGPPYPILVDKKAGPYVVSIWGDPDIGTGTFFIIINSASGNEIPKDLNIKIGIQPVDNHTGEIIYNTQKDSVTNQLQYKTEVKFDTGGFWHIRLILDSSLGKEEIKSDVEATPEGYGRWDLIIYLFPFLAIAVLWIRALSRKRSRRL